MNSRLINSLFWITISIFQPSSLLANDKSTSVLKQTSFRQFSTEQGLSQNTVNHFYQDSRGFMWIATEAGLNRLEGNRIHHFSGPDSTLTSRAINQIKEDSRGNLWVVTYDELLGLSNDHQDSESYYQPASSPNINQPNYIVDLIEEDPDHFWIVSSQGIVRLEPSSKDIQPFISMRELKAAQATITSAYNDGNWIWLATTKGVYRFDKDSANLNKFSIAPTIDDVWIFKIFKSRNNELVISSTDGLSIVSIDASEVRHRSLVQGKAIYAAQKRGDKLYFAYEDQLHTYNLNSGIQKHLFSLSETLPRFSGYAISELYVDRHQKLWIGTQSDGAYLWDPESLNFRTISNLTQNPNLELSEKNVWSMFQDEENNYWIGTDKGLNHLQINQSKITRYLTNDNLGLSSLQKRIFYMLDDEPFLWLATADGLIKFDRNTGQHTVYKPDGFNQDKKFFIFSMAKVPGGDIWLAGKNGTSRFTPSTEQFYFPGELEASDQLEYSTFIRYHDSKLWIGHRNRLETYDYQAREKKTIFQFNHLIKYSDLALTDFYLNGEQLWVSFNASGIYIIDLGGQQPRIIKQLDQKHGFVDNIVHSLLPHENSVWASTHRGLVKIDVESFDYQVFDYFNGLPTNEFNEGAAYISRDGDLVFGGINGLLLISPQNLPQPTHEMIPIITRVSIQDRQLNHNGIAWAQRKLHLSDTERLLTVDFSVLDYFAPHKWQYEYWLSGDLTAQPKITSKNQLTFNNLAQGNYELNIRAVLPNWKTPSPIARLPFSVAKPSHPYLTLKIAAVVIFLLLLFLYFYRNKAYQRKILLSNRQLNEKEQRLKLALLDKHRGIWDWNRGSDKIDASIITIAIAGNEDIVVPISEYHSFVHSDDLNNTQQNWNDFVNGKSPEITQVYRIHLFDKWIWCRMIGRASAYNSESKPTRATGAWLDITREIEAEEKLKVYEKAIQSTRDIIFILNHELNIRSVNQAYRQLTGYSASSLVGKNLLDIANKRFGPDMASELKLQINNNHSWQGEANMPIQGSPSYPIDVRIDAFDPNDEHTDYIIVMTDISSFSARMESKINNSYYDNLTGLPNRVLAKDRLSHAIAHARLHKTNVVLLVLDLDDFGSIAQNIGKSGSREAIVKASKQIAKALNKDDTFARIDEDQFYIILENIEKLENISFKIDEIKSKLGEQYIIKNIEITLSACIGVACFPHDANSATKLTECGSKALQQAKSVGTSQVSYFYRDMNKRAADRLAMKTSLHHAIKNNQFYLVYQPKFQLKDLQLNGFEVFVRWRTLEGNIIYPSQFIKIAEETGAIELLTDWLINQTLETLKQWKQEGINTFFSINLIPKHCQKIGSADYLIERLNLYDLSPMNIHIEISEKHFAEDIGGGLKFINSLNQKGFSVTIDDFGIGNTPLNYLKKLPIHAIKLERNFIRSIGKDRRNDALLTSIIHMTASLGQTPSAKGIEYEEQLTFLLKAGCQVGQGYYFADPLIESGAKQFMLRRSEN